MKCSLLALMLVGATSVTPADADVRLFQGAGYPVCVAIVAALRRMPPSTDALSWPEHLPPIAGVTLPHWTSLDPTQHLDAIRAFMIQRERQQASTDYRSDDSIWSDYAPSVESDIQSGKLLMEETTIRSMKIGWSEAPADRPWTTDVRFLRIGRLATGFGTIGSPFHPEPARTYMDWAYAADWFSLFPDVHNDLVDNGIGGHNLILVAGQPWFVIGGTAMGLPYTNDLEDQHPQLGHRLYVTQRCVIAWQPTAR